MSHDPPSAGPSQPADQSVARPNSYVVVARRYRPKTFDDLVGQQQMTQALINAINTNRVGHAYLFTGARGVGKTSTARIFAKALNAPNGPTPNPDNDSDICQAIDAGEDVDVIEIDGASNRGIDEIRQLRSNANVRPSRARYKIYIIDEVHMLTTAAFNALLKTLEEPPPHVKFIFCTTDPQKIPITVLSRCQRYDFAPVDAPSIVQRLQHIVDSEGRDAELEALQILARRAEGSMRDSQSLLEQLLAYCSGTVRVEDVHRMLGTAASGRLVALTNCLLGRDAAGALAAIDEGVTQGVDCGQLAEQLLGYFRDMMAVVVGGSPDLLRHASEADYPALQEAGERLGLADDPGGVRDPGSGGRADAAEHPAAHAVGDRRRPHLPPGGSRSAGGSDRTAPQWGVASVSGVARTVVPAVRPAAVRLPVAAPAPPPEKKKTDVE